MKRERNDASESEADSDVESESESESESGSESENEFTRSTKQSQRQPLSPSNSLTSDTSFESMVSQQQELQDAYNKIDGMKSLLILSVQNLWLKHFQRIKPLRSVSTNVLQILMLTVSPFF